MAIAKIHCNCVYMHNTVHAIYAVSCISTISIWQKCSENWESYLLFSCPHESISSDGSIDTGYDDVDQSDILDLI